MRIRLTFLFLAAILFSQCSKDSTLIDSPPDRQIDAAGKTIDAADVPDLLNFFERTFSSSSLKGGKIDLPFPQKYIDKKTIIAVDNPENGATNYCFSVKRKKKDNFLFNVTVLQYEDGTFETPRLYKYVFDDEFRDRINQNIGAWIDFDGIIEEYSIYAGKELLDTKRGSDPCYGAGGETSGDPNCQYVIIGYMHQYAPCPISCTECKECLVPVPIYSIECDVAQSAMDSNPCPDPGDNPISPNDPGSDPVEDIIDVIGYRLGYDDPNFLNWLSRNEEERTTIYNLLNENISPDEQAELIAMELRGFFTNSDFRGINNPPQGIVDPPAEIDNGIEINSTIVRTSIPSYAKYKGGSPKWKKRDPYAFGEDLWSGTNGNMKGVIRTDAKPWIQWVRMGLLFEGTTILDGEMDEISETFIDKFKSNTGGEFNNTDLTNKVMRHPTTKNYVKRYGAELGRQLKSGKRTIDQINIIEVVNRPIFNTQFDRFNGYQILINDTEMTEVKIGTLSVNEKTGEWKASIFIEITDHFGLDKGDALKYQDIIFDGDSLGEGFAAWYALQHKHGFKPFKTKIIFENLISGNLND